MNPTKYISLKEYCPHAKSLPLNREDLIKQQVEIEDWINRADEPRQQVPKVTYPEFTPMKPASLYAFIKSILP